MAADDRDQLEAKANAIMGRYVVQQQLQRQQLDYRAGSRKRWQQVGGALFVLACVAYLVLK